MIFNKRKKQEYESERIVIDEQDITRSQDSNQRYQDTNNNHYSSKKRHDFESGKYP